MTGWISSTQPISSVEYGRMSADHDGPSPERPALVLLVDDDRSLLSLMSTWLKSAGYEVAAYTSFVEAKRYLAEHRPDVLITDVRLGAFNGLQLAVMAKQAHPLAVVVALTGYDDAVLRQEATKA